jgi:hypothetical protein
MQANFMTKIPISLKPWHTQPRQAIFLGSQSEMFTLYRMSIYNLQALLDAAQVYQHKKKLDLKVFPDTHPESFPCNILHHHASALFTFSPVTLPTFKHCSGF